MCMVFCVSGFDLLLQCPQGCLGDMARVDLALLVVQGTPGAHPVLMFPAFIRHSQPFLLAVGELTARTLLVLPVTSISSSL